jgi:Spy/CpxP family protein refolding chaperone
MRKLHLAGMSLALTLGGAALASAQSTTAPAQAGTNQAGAATTTTAQPPVSGPRMRLRMRLRHRHHRGLFRGVTLTADQKTKLAGIRDQYRAQAKPLFEQMRATRAEFRAAKAKNDSAAVTAARAKFHDLRSQMGTLRQRWMSDARGVLTPDQQARFDKNVAHRKAAWQKHHNQRAS